MRIGVYNRYWNVLGGGEKYIGAIARHLKAHGSVDLIAHEPFSLQELSGRLNLDLEGCKAVVLGDQADEAAEDISSTYDLWVNGTFQSSVRSRASRSMLVVMFPFLGGKLLKSLWRIASLKQPLPVQQAVWRRYGFWNSYSLIVTLSSYAQNWIRRWWSVESEILRPPADMLNCLNTSKKKLILSVGRFFEGGHNKKHKLMMDVFRQMHDSGLCQSWEYHLCGSTSSEPAHQNYLRSVVNKAKGHPIFVHTDINREELERLYCEATIFWHAAGYGEDEMRWPERFEHFGLSTVEAMSARCVPVVIAKAGQKEIVTQGVSGYLWETTEQLKQYTVELIVNESLARRMAEEARKASTQFSLPFFSERLAHLLKQIL
ncbi:MAG TPA: glycosyltransferase [Blastocatellia bacterium]|nr:glycosyltransferase [Blastocatellia bacterium]